MLLEIIIFHLDMDFKFMDNNHWYNHLAENSSGIIGVTDEIAHEWRRGLLLILGS